MTSYATPRNYEAIKVDIIDEKTASTGVTVESVLLKDGLVDGIDIAALLPAGLISLSARGAAPTGWLVCNGDAVSRTTYSDLYSAIGTTYGVGDGTSTFNVPDLQGRFPLGKALSGTGSTLGSSGGSLDHDHTGPSHTHSVPAHYHAMGAGGTLNIASSGGGTGVDTGNQSAHHTHTVNSSTGVSGSPSASHTHSGTTASMGSHSHTITTRNTATAFGTIGALARVTETGTASTVPTNYNISDGTYPLEGAHDHTFTTGNQSASHTHTVTIDNSTTNHTHQQANHTHAAANFSGTIGKVTGGGENGDLALTAVASGTGNTGTNNPAFLVLNYIIKT